MQIKLCILSVFIFSFSDLNVCQGSTIYSVKDIAENKLSTTSSSATPNLEYTDLKDWTLNSISNYVTVIILAMSIYVSLLAVFLARLSSNFINSRLERIQNDHNNNLLYIELKTRTLTSKHIDEKLALFDKMIEIKPLDYYAYLNKADLLLVMSDKINSSALYKKAIKLIKKGIKSNIYDDNDLSDAYARYGLGLLQDGRYSAAITYYDKAIEYNEEYPQVYCSRAHAFFLQKNFYEAKKNYQIANDQSSPENGNTHNFVFYVSQGFTKLIEKKYDLHK